MADDRFPTWSQAAHHGGATLGVWREGSRTIVGLVGEHDLSTQAELSDVLAGTGPAGAQGDIVVDLSGVTFLDSSTLAALLNGRNLVLGQGGSLVLRAPSPQARRVLEISGLLGLLERRSSGDGGEAGESRQLPGAQVVSSAATSERRAGSR